MTRASKNYSSTNNTISSFASLTSRRRSQLYWKKTYPKYLCEVWISINRWQYCNVWHTKHTCCYACIWPPKFLHHYAVLSYFSLSNVTQCHFSATYKWKLSGLCSFYRTYVSSWHFILVIVLDELHLTPAGLGGKYMYLVYGQLVTYRAAPQEPEDSSSRVKSCSWHRWSPSDCEGRGGILGVLNLLVVCHLKYT